MAQDDGRDERGRWLPGHVANPSGRPKGSRRLTEDIYRVLGEPATGDELKAMFDALNIPPGLQAQIELAGDRQEAFARALVYRALAGSWKAADEIGDRIDPPPKRQEISGPGGGPIRTATTSLTGSISPDDAAATYMGLVRNEPEEVDE